MKSLRNWERSAPRRPGRPPRSRQARWRALRRVARAYRDERGAGIRTITAALGGAVPERLVREVLPAVKRRARRRRDARLAALRVHVAVRARDALWSLDQTHVGRGVHGVAQQALVVRDVATTATIEVALGHAASGAEVVAVLERARAARGAAPLALATDNGPENVNADVAAWCTRHGVLPLRNLPHTPQHNAWVEHGHRELKEATGLGKGVVIGDPAAAERLLIDAARRIDANRVRPSRGGHTARALDAELPRGYAQVAREDFLAECAWRRDSYLQSAPKGRARRLAERRAVLDALEHYGLIQRTRGGAS